MHCDMYHTPFFLLIVEGREESYSLGGRLSAAVRYSAVRAQMLTWVLLSCGGAKKLGCGGESAHVKVEE